MARSFDRLTVWHGTGHIEPPNEDQYLCSRCCTVWLDEPNCARCGKPGLLVASLQGVDSELWAYWAEWLTEFVACCGPVSVQEGEAVATQQLNPPMRWFRRLVRQMEFDLTEGVWQLPPGHPWFGIFSK